MSSCQPKVLTYITYIFLYIHDLGNKQHVSAPLLAGIFLQRCRFFVCCCLSGPQAFGCGQGRPRNQLPSHEKSDGMDGYFLFPPLCTHTGKNDYLTNFHILVDIHPAEVLKIFFFFSKIELGLHYPAALWRKRT